jgi:hypothetical protein
MSRHRLLTDPVSHNRPRTLPSVAHNLFQARLFGIATTQETIDFINNNNLRINRLGELEPRDELPFNLDIEVEGVHTPTYQSDSDSDTNQQSSSIMNENDIVDDQVNHENDNVSQLSPVDNNNSSLEGSSYQNNTTVLIQNGIDGNPVSSKEAVTSVFVSNQPKIRLDSTKTLTHELIQKFTAQVLNKDFTSPIESLIDKNSWELIFMLAKARCSTSSSADTERYNQIIQLEDYINRKEGSYQFLDNTIWNMTSMC